MNLFSFIGDIFKPASDLVDNLHTSEEEKLTLLNELNKIKAGMQAKSVELMAAEAKSDHWIVASIRPICTLILILLIVADAYGWADAPPQIYSLAEIFISVYAGGRSFEKIARVVKK